MSDRSLPEVGREIHRLRRGRGLSLRDLARESGLSPNAISRIERGECSPTVSSLRQLATALGVEIGSFFQPAPGDSTVVVREHQRPRTSGKGVLIEGLGSGLPGQRLGPFCMTLLPGAYGADQPISHAGEEFVYCLEGEVDCLVQGDWHRLRSGDSLLFLASQHHLCKNTGLVEAKLLFVIQAPSEEVLSAQQRHLMVPLARGSGPPGSDEDRGPAAPRGKGPEDPGTDPPKGTFRHGS